MQEKTDIGVTYRLISKNQATATGTREGVAYSLAVSEGNDKAVEFVAISTTTDIETSGSYVLLPVFNRAPVNTDGGGINPYTPNQVVGYSGSYTGEVITIPNGKILALTGLNGLALADLSGLAPESLGDGVYSTGECYIPAMATPPPFKWSESLLWIDGQAATGQAPTIAANTAYRLALRKEGLQIFANLTYYNAL